MIDRTDIIAMLRQFETGLVRHNLVDEQLVVDVRVQGTAIEIDLLKRKWTGKQQSALESELSNYFGSRGLTLQKLNYTDSPPSPGGNNSQKKASAGASPFEQQHRIPGIKHIIAVASGKGGVGKSTISSNLAVTLGAMNFRVGLLDADIYGPSMNLMMGQLNTKPTTPDGKRIDPVVAYGIKTISMGYLTSPEQAVIWRGPMLMKAVNQFLNDVNWGELDFLIIDMPPGTGDVQLSITQEVPLSGAIIVTTPQDVALMDVKRGVRMFEKVSVPVLGVVENMSYHVCRQCGHMEHIFGTEKVEKMVTDLKTQVIGQFPLDASIVSASDSGRPIVLDQPESVHGKAYLEIAEKVLIPLVK